MKRGLWLISIFLGLGLVSVAAAPPPPLYEFGTGGGGGSFVLALDEMAVERGGVWTVEPVPAQESGHALAGFVRQAEPDADRPAGLVLYEHGRPRTVWTRRIAHPAAVVRLLPGIVPEILAANVGARSVRPGPVGRDYFIFEFDSAFEALTASGVLAAREDTLLAYPLTGRLYKKMTPPVNDPYFPLQWHLLNTGQNGAKPGVDVNVTNAWALGYWGSGVTIGIVDDGLQATHEDLAVNTALGRNWNGAPGGTNDPRPDLESDFHGTAVAGCAAAIADNATGVAGVAPQAALVGMRLVAGQPTEEDIAEAMLHANSQIQVKNNSWGYEPGGLGHPGAMPLAAFLEGATSGRDGRGTIYVFASGNGRTQQDDANYNALNTSPYTLVVGGVAPDGGPTTYATPGACVVVSAPTRKGVSKDSLGIVTTDLVGNNGYNGASTIGDLDDKSYTRHFSGTSASASLVSGTVALMLEANPELGWRDVQEILVRSARKNDPDDSDWIVNAAGLHFNHKYGAGLIDASAAVSMAETWTNLSAAVSHTIVTNLSLAIPDNDPDGVTVHFDLVGANMIVEHVELAASITHTWRGDLGIRLISPEGTESVLAERRIDPGDDYDAWPFMTVRKWGEQAQGRWHVHVADLAALDVGEITRLELTVRGRPAAPLSDQPPVIGPIAPVEMEVGETFGLDVAAWDYIDYDPVALGLLSAPACLNIEFPAASASGFVSVPLTMRPVATGDFSVVFMAEDKDGLVQREVPVSVRLPRIDVLKEPFQSEIAPPGWTLVSSSGDAWRFDDPMGRGNRTGGTGRFAIADSGYGTSSHVRDMELHSPHRDCRGSAVVELSFETFFLTAGGEAVAQVDVSPMFGFSWTNVWQRTNEYSGTVRLDVSEHLAGQQYAMVRFHYRNAAHHDGYWQVDNVNLFLRMDGDADGDGLPDWWEWVFSGSSTGIHPDDYLDGGTHTAWQHWLAGTNPTNAQSALRMESVTQTEANGATLAWASAPGRRYAIRRWTNLVAGGYETVASNIAATPPQNTYTDEGEPDMPARFYRIVLE